MGRRLASSFNGYGHGTPQGQVGFPHCFSHFLPFLRLGFLVGFLLCVLAREVHCRKDRFELHPSPGNPIRDSVCGRAGMRAASSESRMRTVNLGGWQEDVGEERKKKGVCLERDEKEVEKG